jgi:hypothetical protein
MMFTATRLADAFVIDVELYADERGFLGLRLALPR